jgi:anti-anti-sigma factor
MDTDDSASFKINVNCTGEAVTLLLGGRFSFKTHHEFKNAYKPHLADAKIVHIIIDLADVTYLDSSALGLLLMLRDQAQAVNKPVTLARPSSIAARSFDIANFNKLFIIN